MDLHIIRIPGVDEMYTSMEEAGLPSIPATGTLLNVFAGETWEVTLVLVDTQQHKVVVWVDCVAHIPTPVFE